MASDGSCLVRFLLFGSVQAVTELVGSGLLVCEAVAGRQVIPIKLAVWSVDVFSLGRTGVFIKTSATAASQLYCMFAENHPRDLLQMTFKCLLSHHLM